MKKSTSPISITHPELLKIWDYAKNMHIADPDKITFGSHTKIYWNCEKFVDHNYYLSINAKTNNKNGCPQCSGLIVSAQNCLLNKYPQIINLWDFNLNIFSPTDIQFSSHKNIWIKCQNTIHPSYKTTPNKITSTNSRCPLCANNLANKGLLHLNINLNECWLNKAIKNKKSIARLNNRSWELSKEDAVFLLTKECFYCKRYFDKKMGIDRVNNNIGYQLSNCVSCCKFCNSAKKDLTIPDFKSWIFLFKNPIETNVDKYCNGNVSFNTIKHNAIKRKIEFHLTKNDVNNLIKNKCYYCKTSDSIGIDRYDNKIGYFITNCVSCCKICNRAKLNQTILEFNLMINGLILNYNKY